MKRTSPAFTEKPIGRTMFQTALTMLPGTIAVSGYNIADTYFVSRMNDWRELAAMGYVFPVVMIFSFIFSGFATGVMTTTAQALGGRRRLKASHLITSGLFFALLLSVACGLFGYCFLDATFQSLGAGEEILPKIENYMAVWYLFGAVTAALGFVGNNVFMSIGSTRTASFMMLGGLMLNVVLDPIFIFGKFGVPAMGIGGAAWATVLSQGLCAVVMLLQLCYRYRFLTTSIFNRRILPRTGRLILNFAVPAILGMLLIPLGNTVITAILSQFGDQAVAAVSTVGRLEIVAFVFPMSIGMGLMPMIGQNYGAGLYLRINQCRRVAMRAAFLLLATTGTLFFLFAEPLARIFSDDPEMLAMMTTYLKIVAPAFCMVEIHRFSTFFYTGCGRPAIAAWLNALRIFGFLVPFSLTALAFHSLTGVFWARFAADLFAGLIALYFARKLTRNLLDEQKSGEQNPSEKRSTVRSLASL